MKKLIVVNGTMGVGKTTICKELYKSLDKSVWLDGDWCWMMNPWIFNEENIRMVVNNITYLLRNFLTNSTFAYVIFNWVLHREEILTGLLNRLSDLDFQVKKVTLMCSEAALRQRMKQDNRSNEQIILSIERLRLYESMDTNIIDTSESAIEEILERIKEIIN
ncbi:shikimate kinase [Paenibacillus rhizosphaerae]|uniref:Shikimate kinase n=1 Tax=Paenibacillus rhizosphaerae TaxID=297318 RepID=A0A839TV61_9BACL|nr:AAA family ATPase [Paenibacillus rhizosphaerae]MBB3128577.1 shikimate kinase [Paenibacillus rhizosphaerae]